jgi:hypothetical protein
MTTATFTKRASPCDSVILSGCLWTTVFTQAAEKE